MITSVRLRKYNYEKIAYVTALIFSLVVYFPGFMTNDSTAALTQAREGYYNDWHSPLFSYIWHYVDIVISGPFGMLVLQLTLYWSALYLIFASAIKDNTKISVIAILAIGFFPPIFSLMGVIWKGNLMEVLLLFIFAILIATDIKGKKIVYAVILFMMVGCMALRHNAIGSIIAVIWYILYLNVAHRLNKYRLIKLIGLLIISVVVSVGIRNISTSVNSLIMDEKGNVWQYIATLDLAGTFHFSDESTKQNISNLVKQKPKLHKAIPLNANQIYKAYYARKPIYYKRLYTIGGDDRFQAISTERELDDLRLIWKSVVIQNPIAYLKHRLFIYKQVINLESRPPWIAYWMKSVERQRQKILLSIDGRLSGLQLLIEKIYSYLSMTFLFLPYLYLLAGLLLWPVTFFMLKNGLHAPFFLLASGFSHHATIFFAAPSPDYRYSHWLVLVVCISYVLVLNFLLDSKRRSVD